VSATLLTALRDELERLVHPLTAAVEDVASARRLLASVGAGESFATKASLLNALSAAAALRAHVDAVVDAPEPSFAGVAAAFKAAGDLFLALRALDASDPDFARLGSDLVEVLTGQYLRSEHPLVYGVGALLTLVEVEGDPAFPPKPGIARNGEVVRLPFSYARLRFDRLHQLINDPEGVLGAMYFPNGLATVADANAAADLLFPRVGAILTQLGVAWTYGLPDEERSLLGDAAPFVDHAFQVYVPSTLTGSDAEAGITFTLSSDDRGGLGLVLSPFGALEFSTQVDQVQVDFKIGAEIQALAVGGQGATFIAAADAASVSASFAAKRIAETEGAPAFVFGSATGTHLEIGAAELGAAIDASLDAAAVTASVAASSGALVIAPGDGDSFVNAILPEGGLRATFDLGVGYSTKNGLSLQGGAGLEATLPVSLSLGGVVGVKAIHLGVAADADGVAIETSAVATLDIGPVHAVVDRAGLVATAAFPEGGGNLGVADLQVRFKPPSGVGVSIDAAGLGGGGYLFHDDAKHEYAGVLQLDFHSFKLTAFGLLATVLPTGPGYSLIVMVDAEFPPIQLGFGFALTGAGGLLGVHRTANVEGLRAALTAHTISNLLFPKNPISNAPQLLTELDTLFPGADGRYVFGPIVRVAWGTPALLTLDLALILELPDPIKLILIAELTVLLPTPEEKAVEIHLSALGTLDFGACEAGLDATLHDSRLVIYPLHGAMALRVAWSGKKTFLLAIGGVHPKFQAPPGFPKLDRVGISMPSGPISKLTLDGYLAITSNTYQLGAHVDLFVGVDGFGISGYLAFDTLIQRHPFHFDADISGAITLSAGGEDLMSLKMNASLSGPGPWNAAGSVSFDVLWWTVTKSFHHTFGDPLSDAVIEAVDVGQLLRTALADAQSFSPVFAPGETSLVTLRKPDVPTTVILAHPAASLSVHQTVVPLGLTIDHFGGATPSGETSFAITGVSVNDDPQQSPAPVLDDFAAAQFLTLTDDEKLARPSFEQLAAGVTLTADMAFGAPTARQVAYDTFFADTLDEQPREDPGLPTPVPGHVLADLLLDGAAALSELAQSGSARYAGPKRLVAPAELDFVVVTSDQLATSGVGAESGLTYSQAQAALRAELAQHPERRAALLVTARYEVER
jgi:hypothetical protein